MRLIELLILISLALYLLWPFFTGKQNQKLVHFIPVITTALISLHLVLEGYRWQMVPLYTMAGILLLISLVKMRSSATFDFHRVSWAAAGRILTLVLLGIASTPPILLPVPNISKPSGPYSVGTRSFVLTDNSRLELYSGQQEPRKFMVQVWYPASPENSQKAPWANNAPIFARAFSDFFELPKFFLDHLALVYPPAYQDAPLALSSNPYPIIMFSHGWNGFAAQNTGQALELASRGYIVVGMQHTYGAVVTVFPDGKIAYNNPNALPSGLPDEEYDPAARILADQWARDIAFALDFLTAQSGNPKSPFYKRLNLEKVGAYGHSTGGGAAIQFCGTDSRCKAVLGMDPFMTPVSEDVMEKGLPQPALFMFSQSGVDNVASKNNRLFKHFHENIDPVTLVIGIEGTAHYDFGDIPMLSPVAHQLGLKGPIKMKRVTEIIQAYLIAFYDLTLNGKPTDLFIGPSPYQEVIKLY